MLQATTTTTTTSTTPRTTRNTAPESTTVREGLEHYLAENGFSTDEYTAPKFTMTAGPLAFEVPNPPVRQRVVALHDLHHVATGYGTDLVGEAEVAMFELRAGCTSPFLWGINLLALPMGLALAPRRMVHAWRRARGARTLYKLGATSADVQSLTVAALRERLGLPREGIADAPRHLHARAPQPA